MIEQWLNNDFRNIYTNHFVAVLVDEYGDVRFLLKTLGHEPRLVGTGSMRRRFPCTGLLDFVGRARRKQSRKLVISGNATALLFFGSAGVSTATENWGEKAGRMPALPGFAPLYARSR